MLKGWELGSSLTNFSLFVHTIAIVPSKPIDAVRRLRQSRRQPRCKRREHRSVANFELLKDVMQVHFDCAINNVQPPPYFLVRQPFGHETHDLALALG